MHTVWQTTNKLWKRKLRIALKAAVVFQLTENKTFKCSPIFPSAPLRKCSIIIPLYPVNQATFKQTNFLEYKIERDSTTTKAVFCLPL